MRRRFAGAAFVAAAATLLALRHHPYALTLAWSATLFVSYVGWGSLAAHAVVPRCHLDWGLRAGWGMAITCLTGGFLACARAAIAPVLIAQTVVGVALFLWFVRVPWNAGARARNAWLEEPGIATVVGGAYALAAFVWIASLGNQDYQASDDLPLYMVFAEKLVQTGSFFEPYVARRATVFGGQVYFHGSLISVAPMCYLHVFDVGVAFFVVVGLVVGGIGTAPRRARDLLPLALATIFLFTLRDVRVNTTSQFSGVAAFLTLYRTVRAAPDDLRPPWPVDGWRVAALAALSVECIVLRTTNAAAAVPFVALVLASDFLRAPRRGRREALGSVARASAVAAATTVVLLLPWAVMMHESTGAYFYPLDSARITPGWTLLATAKNSSATAVNIVRQLFHDRPLAALIPFVFAGLAPLRGRARNDLWALTVASLFAVVVLVARGADFGVSHTSRYLYAYVVGSALCATSAVRRFDARGALVVTGIAAQLTAGRQDIADTFTRLVRESGAAFAHRSRTAAAFEANVGAYRSVQSHVPPGATMLTAVHEGWQFDFKRNPILALDELGGMGPGAGWPAFAGPKALDTYLHANGAQYLVWVDFGLPSEFYNREHWRSFLDKDGWYLQSQARFQLDGMDAIEKLTAMHRVVYREQGMTVVDLSASGS